MILPGFGERAHRAGREHLHRDVAERGRLDRPGEHGPPGGVRRELIQQPVARSAADDPDRRVAMAAQLLERLEDRAVLERQALENRARVAGLSRGLRLAGLPAVGRDRRRHVLRVEEPAVVRIEERSERVLVVARRRQQVVVRRRLAGFVPAPHARLQQPQAADVLEQPRRAADAAFVGEIQLPRPGGNHRRRPLRRRAATTCPS